LIAYTIITGFIEKLGPEILGVEVIESCAYL